MRDLGEGVATLSQVRTFTNIPPNNTVSLDITAGMHYVPGLEPLRGLVLYEVRRGMYEARPPVVHEGFIALVDQSEATGTIAATSHWATNSCSKQGDSTTFWRLMR